MSPRPRARNAGLAGATLVLLAAASCGPGSADPLTETAANLDRVESGRMRLSVVFEAPSEGTAGFELAGDFEMPEEGALPVADMTYTQIAGSDETTTGFLSTGSRAFVEVDDVYYELPEENVAPLRGSADVEGSNVFEDVGLDDWIRHPEVSNAGQIDGVEIERISGDVDVEAAIADILEIAERFGADAPSVEGEDLEHLREAISDTTLTIDAGKDNHILRRLSMDMTLAAAAPEEVAHLDLPSRVEMSLDLILERVNEPVTVQAPSDFLSLEDLVGG